ncbi:MAG: hypothetical protein K0R29_2979 [Pseudobdellovibrio sp.]|jgi:hypothetical protein|nr:hypothetical protein [Pseudobdellovibrio sp.]
MKINKKQVLIRTVCTLALLAGPAAFAGEDSDLREGPCNKILDACKSYAKISKTKISLYRDCMQPLLNNEKISEIKIDAEDLKACQAKKAEIKQKK